MTDEKKDKEKGYFECYAELIDRFDPRIVAMLTREMTLYCDECGKVACEHMEIEEDEYCECCGHEL